MWIVDYLTFTQTASEDPASPIIRSIALNCSTTFAERRRAQYAYFTPQDQEARSPGDKFCRLVPSLQSKTIKWPF